MEFPSDGRDFLTLTLEDVRIGAYYLVTSAAATANDMWVPAMQHTMHMVGRAKAVHPGEELVLLQFFDAQHSIFAEYWYAVETLRVAPSGARRLDLSSVDYGSLLSQLRSTHLQLSALIARRAVFTLVSRGGPSADAFLQQQMRERGIDSLLEWVFLSVSESLELSDLTRLGDASSEAREMMFAFTTNLIAFLNQQRAGAGATPLTSTQLCRHILRLLKHHVTSAAAFSTSGCTTSGFTLQPLPPVASAPGAAAPPAADNTDLWLHLRVEHASALVLMFSKDTRLSKGSLLSVHPDDSASELLKSYAGREEPQILTPLVTPGSECYLRVTPPEDIPARSSIKILPISSSLPLAFWLIDLLLNPNTSTGASSAPHVRQASGASSSSAMAPSSESMMWAEGYEDGGLIGLCYTLCELILENFRLEELPPSPLKESLLKVVSKLLTRITTTQHAMANSLDGLARPRIHRQMSQTNSKSQEKSLNILRRLHSEMVALYALESSNAVYTSYLQQLVDLLAASDELRPPADRLCSKFEFRAALSEQEKKEKAAAEAAAAAEAEKANAAPAMWTCSTCTFENAMSASGCGQQHHAAVEGEGSCMIIVVRLLLTDYVSLLIVCLQKCAARRSRKVPRRNPPPRVAAAVRAPAPLRIRRRCSTT
jgi:hypothetical protein